MKLTRAPLLAAWLLCASALADESAGTAYVPYQSSGIYALGETAGWNVTLPWNSPTVSYVIRKNNLAEIGRGSLTPGKPSKIEVKLDEPGMVFVEVTENTPGAKPKAVGASVSRRSTSRRDAPSTRWDHDASCLQQAVRVAATLRASLRAFALGELSPRFSTFVDNFAGHDSC